MLLLPLCVAAQPRDNAQWKLDGALKTKFEWGLNSGDVRFNLRNSRIGLSGNLSQYAAYRVQVELSNEGKFDILDGFITLNLLENGGIRLGQSSVPFENSYIITPSQSLFANRAFVGKFFTAGSRDIGAVAYYNTGGAFPFLLEGGVFNGGKINNPQWTKRPSLALRLTMGSLEHFRASVKAYRYANEANNPDEEKDWLFWGADVSYRKKDYLLQAEVMNRYDYNASRPADKNFTGAYLQSAYIFHYPCLKLFHSITPAVRWDAMTYGLMRSGVDVHRVTAGLAFGLTDKPFDSCLRIDFEHYFVRSESRELAGSEDHVSDNKLTLELLLVF
ncbi:MAG: hypothetical protein LBD52_02120 [Prevotellaceae bacterium]|jgi:hypothetical protein|nr:hypothetical protein [Prevotellaceae bacterium]